MIDYLAFHSKLRKRMIASNRDSSKKYSIDCQSIYTPCGPLLPWPSVVAIVQQAERGIQYMYKRRISPSPPTKKKIQRSLACEQASLNVRFQANILQIPPISRRLPLVSILKQQPPHPQPGKPLLRSVAPPHLQTHADSYSHKTPRATSATRPSYPHTSGT